MRRRELRELAGLFLLLGTIGFGGPPAHIALFELEVVRKRKWLTPEELLELIGATNLIPGPNSTEIAFSIGLRRAGLPGMIVAGISFILPAALITGLLAWLYVAYGASPEFVPFLKGTKAAIIGVIVATCMRLAPTATKTLKLAAIGALSLIASTLGAPEVAVLLGAGLLALLGDLKKATAAAPFLLVAKAFASGGAVVASATLGGLFLFFLYVGATIFGGGFVLASYLENGLVREMGWLTQGQLLDAITIGQVTPGPVFSTATFVGFLIGGAPGALLATVAIFLPCFLLVPLLHRLVDWAKKHPRTSLFIDGVNVAAVALMLSVAIRLAPASLPTWQAGVLAALAGIGIFARLNAGLVVVAAGLIAYIS